VERGVLLSPGLPSAADLGLRAQAAGGAAKLEEMSLDEVERESFNVTSSHGSSPPAWRAAAPARASRGLPRGRRAGREEHAAFHRMIELPNIAWPGMLMRAFMAAGSKPEMFCDSAARNRGQNGAQEIDVSRRFSQRRDWISMVFRRNSRS